MKSENPFKENQKNEKEVPEGLKKKVMGDIANAKTILELSGLFLDNIPSAIREMLKTNSTGRNN